MTTYNTYQEAKIAHPESEIYVTRISNGGRDDVFGLHDDIEEFTSNYQEANPADHCMTVEKFLVDGHEVFMGDAIININGNVNYITKGDEKVINSEGGATFNNARYILRAAALEDIPTETPEEKEVLDGIESAGEVEWKNGDECRYNEINWLFCGFHPVNRLAIVANNDVPSSHQVITVDVDLLSKPETPQQREDRERLEAAYDLYEEAQHAIGCIGYDDFDFFKKSDIQVKFWLAIVDKTNYRKEKTHGTN